MLRTMQWHLTELHKKTEVPTVSSHRQTI